MKINICVDTACALQWYSCKGISYVICAFFPTFDDNVESDLFHFILLVINGRNEITTTTKYSQIIYDLRFDED